MIETWLLWQTVKVSFWVFLGAFLFAVIIWKLLDRNERKDKSCFKN